MELSRTFLRLKKRLEKSVGQAIHDYRMIDSGDKVMVCVSGGKDSLTLLSVLMAMQARSPVQFSLVAMNLDQRQPGFPAEVLPAYFDEIGVDYRLESQDTYSVVQEKIAPGKTTCSLCSRLRRGAIYRVAREIGANKVALGHHRDDIVQTFFLNLFFAGKLKAMPPKLVTDDGTLTVIRPLAYCSEADIIRYVKQMSFPIIPCNLCGSQQNLQRQKISLMLNEWEKQFPGRTETIFNALQNVVPSHLADRHLFDFSALCSETLASATEGDDLVSGL